MELRECTSHSEWDAFVLVTPHTPFHQTWEWGELEVSRGEKVQRLQCVMNGKVLAQAQLWSHLLPGGFCYAYLPRGPVFLPEVTESQKEEAITLIAQKVATEKKNIFLLWEPLMGTTETRARLPREFSPTKNRLPRHTLILDLSQPTETLKKNLHPKWRYNIELAKRKGVVVTFEDPLKNLQLFLELLKKTSTRDGFTTPSTHHFNLLAKHFSKEKNVRLVLAMATHEKTPVAGALLLHTGDTVTYLHGASDYEFRNLMAPHLVQWESILWAKRQGAHWYDFWGIAPEGSVKEKAWAGVTRFKMGFGGTVINYPQAQTFIYKKLLFALYSLISRIKSL